MRKPERSTSDCQFTDQALMERLVCADPLAFRELYHLYHKRVYRQALSIVEDEWLADELTQDVFLKLWNKAHLWQPKTNLRHWLSVLTWYMAVKRREREHERAVRKIQLSQRIKCEAAIEAGGEHLWEDLLLLRLMLDTLPPEQAQAIALAFLEGHTHSQIADLLNLPLGTVKTRVRSGINRLCLSWKDQEA